MESYRQSKMSLKVPLVLTVDILLQTEKYAKSLKLLWNVNRHYITIFKKCFEL